MLMRILTFAVSICFVVIFIQDSAAQRRGVSLIRDAEIEHIIASYTTPLSLAANLDPSSVRVHIVNDAFLNAFVVGGQRVFINTGLLLRAKSPNQIIGVIAHELGHIAGGHLARTQEALSNASVPTIIAMVLGAAAAAAGQGQAGAAVIAGGQHLSQRSLLQYSRTQESAADQAAIRYLEASQQSSRGLIEFLEILGDQEALLSVNQDPYVRSHPISRERIGTLVRLVEQSPYRDKLPSDEAMTQFKRMQAKLTGFLEQPARTFQDYPESDRSIPARYARAVAYYRIPELTKALAEIDGLLAEMPEDPYFHELKGQMLFEHGRVTEAVQSYRLANRHLPDAPLIQLALGQALVASGDNGVLPEAIQHIRRSLTKDPRNANAWKHLALAYGRSGDLGNAAMASAERAMLRGEWLDAKRFAARALKILARGTPGWLRAQDIEHAADREHKKKKK